MRILPSLMSLLALAACATPSPEARIRSKLLEMGLSRPVASCMAERLVDRLSPAQLHKLASLSKLKGADLHTMTVDDFLRRARALGDSEILRVVASAGIGCAIAA